MLTSVTQDYVKIHLLPFKGFLYNKKVVPPAVNPCSASHCMLTGLICQYCSQVDG